MYKGYYYDEETQLYYCNSRYYDSNICRWISIDEISYLDSDDINGINLWCYCGNNPVMGYDPDGFDEYWWNPVSWSNTTKWIVGGVAFIGAITLTAMTGGSLVPIIIGMGSSILSSGFLSGIQNVINDRAFKEGFANGCADGALLGGIFALANSTIRTIKILKNGVVIGENMNRVRFTAKMIGGVETYGGKPGFKLLKLFCILNYSIHSYE